MNFGFYSMRNGQRFAQIFTVFDGEICAATRGYQRVVAMFEMRSELLPLHDDGAWSIKDFATCLLFYTLLYHAIA